MRCRAQCGRLLAEVQLRGQRIHGHALEGWDSIVQDLFQINPQLNSGAYGKCLTALYIIRNSMFSLYTSTGGLSIFGVHPPCAESNRSLNVGEVWVAQNSCVASEHGLEAALLMVGVGDDLLAMVNFNTRATACRNQLRCQNILVLCSCSLHLGRSKRT